MITFILLLSLVFAAKCDDYYFVYSAGTLQYGNEIAQKIFGRLTVVIGPRHKYTELTGMYVGGKHIPFAFAFDVEKSTIDGDKIYAEGPCTFAAWDAKKTHSVSGGHMVYGAVSEVGFEATCNDLESKTNYVIKLEGLHYDCEVFKAGDAAVRAQFLLGESRDHYLPAQVLNFAYYDYPYLSVLPDCKFYLNMFGAVGDETKPGYAIVGKDGAHCAVVDKEGDKFIHMNPVKNVVTTQPLTMIKEFFKAGWVIKKVPCNGPH